MISLIDVFAGAIAGGVFSTIVYRLCRPRWIEKRRRLGPVTKKHHSAPWGK